jgi:ADP-ribosyl-[dinitrogen reductase] hydrolase
MTRQNRKYCMIMGSVIGDAMGVPYEFQKADEFKFKPLAEGGVHGQESGVWSDDSSLLLITARTIAEGSDQTNIVEDLKESFFAWLALEKETATGEIFDIGFTTKAGILNEDISDTSMNKGTGSLMRIAPLAGMFDVMPEHAFYRMIKEVSSITHNSEVCVKACKLLCILLYTILNIHRIGGKKSKLELWEAALNVMGEANVPSTLLGLDSLYHKDIDDSGHVLAMLKSSVYSWLTTTTFEDAIRVSVGFGKDTDTRAAITGALAGAYYGYVPSKWLLGLKRMEYVMEIASRYSLS